MSNKFVKSMLLVLPITMLMGSIALASPINVYVNNSKTYMPISPIANQGRTLVPLRSIFESMGAKVGWNQDTKIITVRNANKEIKLKVGSNIATLNDKKIILDAPPTIINGSTLVPTRFVAENLGAKVDWHTRSKSVLINSSFTDMNKHIENNYSYAEYAYSDLDDIPFKLDEFKNKYGQPISQTHHYNDRTLSYDKILNYKFGEASFESYENKYFLTGFSSKENLTGLPRNIKIGDSVESIINKFRSDGIYDLGYYLEDNEKLLYQSANSDGTPSIGVIKYNNKNEVVNIEYCLDYETGQISRFNMKIKDNKVHSVSMFFGQT